MSLPNSELFAGRDALTFDDVLVVPGWSEVLPSEATTSTSIAGIDLHLPLLSAAMDTVTEAPLAIALAREGGLGILHRNMTILEQADQVDRVKRSQAGMITAPVSLSPTATLADAEELMSRHSISGVPITDDDERLVGILTNRDIRFCTEAEYHRPVTDFMTTRNLVTAPVGTSLEDAVQILHQHRIEKLPLVDGQGRLRGLITVKDITKRVQKPHSTVDPEGRLRVGAAIGVNDAIGAGRGPGPRRGRRPGGRHRPRPLQGRDRDGGQCEAEVARDRGHRRATWSPGKGWRRWWRRGPT